jgi:hypothetical protein
MFKADCAILADTFKYIGVLHGPVVSMAQQREIEVKNLLEEFLINNET